jgi:uroporphyrinogen-III synthase
MNTERPLQGLHIAVTRPMAQAQSLCRTIAAQGGTPIPYPLLAVTAIDDYAQFNQQLTKLATTDWAIFISSNAVDFAMPRVVEHYPKLPSQLQFAAIGPQTAEALAPYGVDKVLIPHQRYDSETLMSLPEMQNVAGKTVMIFRGVGGRELMGDTLKARGAQVYFAESYQRINPQTDTRLLDHYWQQGKLDALVVTSSEAMRYLLILADKAPWLALVTLCVNHERIAELPKAHGLKVLVAEAPGDAAMMQCLSTLNVSS